MPNLEKPGLRFPVMSVSLTDDGNLIVEIASSPMESHKFFILEELVRQIFITYGIQCSDQAIRDMLQTRSLKRPVELSTIAELNTIAEIKRSRND